MTYKKIRKNPAQFLSLTGFEIATFDELLKDFSVEVNDYLSHYTFRSCLKSVENCNFAKNAMKHTQTICCPYCGTSDLVKNGHSENGTQRWRCNGCRKSFQLDYRYNARKQGVKEQIAELTLNSSGVRDISRILHISTNTVTTELKKNAKPEPLSS